MRKSLQSIGNSLGIIIDRPILELLNFTPEHDVEITTDGRRIILEPVTRVPASFSAARTEDARRRGT